MSTSETGIPHLVTALQTDSWGVLGVEPSDIPDRLRQIFLERFMFNPDEDPASAASLLDRVPVDDLYQQLRGDLDAKGLPLQCPYTYLLVDLWRKRFHRQVSSEDPGSAGHPLIASAYTGDVNARTYRAQDGTRAIVFEDELLHFFQVASQGLYGMFVHREGNQLSFDLSWPPSEARLAQLRVATDWLFGSAVRSMLVHGSVMQREEKFAPPVQHEIDLTLAGEVAGGLFNFVYAHELAHINAQHYELLWGEANRPIPRRPVPEQEDAFKRCKLRYPELLAALGEEQVHLFLTRQMMEVEADCFACTMLINSWRAMETAEGMDRLRLACMLAGGFSTLVLFWMIEQMALIIAYGKDIESGAYPVALLTEDDLVQNLCFRSTHPTPINRMLSVESFFQDERVAAAMASQNDARWAEDTGNILVFFNQLRQFLIGCFQLWLDDERTEQLFKLGLGSIKPQWQKMLDDMPKPAGA